MLGEKISSGLQRLRLVSEQKSAVKPRYSFLWLINFVWHSVLHWIVVQILKMHSLHKAKLQGCP